MERRISLAAWDEGFAGESLSQSLRKRSAEMRISLAAWDEVRAGKYLSQNFRERLAASNEGWRSTLGSAQATHKPEFQSKISTVSKNSRAALDEEIAA